MNMNWKTTKVSFGNKHKGEALISVMLNDPSFVKWCLNMGVKMPREEKEAFENALEYINTHYPERIE